MTDISDVQVILTMAIVAAVALFVLLDRRSKNEAKQQMQRLKWRHSPTPRPLRPIPLSTPRRAPSPAPRPAVPHPMEPPPQMIPVVVSEPPMKPAPARETVTIEFHTLLDQATRPAAPRVIRESAPLPAFTIDAELWERLIASMPSQELLTAGGQPAEQPVPERPVLEQPFIETAPQALTVNYEIIDPAPESGWPKGVISQSALQKLLDGADPFSGLVVSIGVNDADSSMRHSQGLMQSVGDYLAELSQPNDFSCRTDYDEFILACPGETGAPAQRRLSHISERLWDYQLRGIGAASILFSWGAVHVQDQPLAEAVASAVDRMHQTKRLSTGSTLTRARYAAV